MIAEIQKSLSQINHRLEMLTNHEVKLTSIEKDLQAHEREIDYLKSGLKEEKQHGKNIADRVLALEKAPAENMAGGVRRVVAQIISILVAAAAGGILTMLFK
jgi:predicted RNase H-like nuclease (RuvC/YqgF family)